MGKGSSRAPDVRGAAETEGKYSRETARDTTYADRPNQYGPFGNLTWGTTQVRDPATGEMVTQWNQNQTLDPRAQAQLDRSYGMMGKKGQMAEQAQERARQDMSQPVDWDQFGDQQGLDYSYLDFAEGAQGIGDPNQFNRELDYLDFDPSDQMKNAEDAFYNKETQRLDPRMAAERESTELRLRGQGLAPGDQAYESAMSSFSNQKNDAYERARYGAVDQGRQTSDQLYRQSMGLSEELSGRERQAWDMNRDQFGARQGESQQLFDQQRQQADWSNALRSGNMQEYLAKRGFAQKEADYLNEGQNVSDIANLVTGQGA